VLQKVFTSCVTLPLLHPMLDRYQLPQCTLLINADSFELGGFVGFLQVLNNHIYHGQIVIACKTGTGYTCNSSKKDDKSVQARNILYYRCIIRLRGEIVPGSFGVLIFVYSLASISMSFVQCQSPDTRKPRH
jgi:hypothetical protein